MRKTVMYRLYPTHEQRRLLDPQLEECRWLDHRLLEERKTAWDERQESVRLYDQQALLPDRKAKRPSLARVQSHVLQNVAGRIDRAFKAFFRRVKAGEAPGDPRFRGVGRSDSVTFPQMPVGCHLDAEPKRLRVMNVGLVTVVLHRPLEGPLEGTPKTAPIERSRTGNWDVSVSCACADPTPLPATGHTVGIAVGLKPFATLTAGDPIANPRVLRQDERALRGAQRRWSTVEKDTPERSERCRVVARSQERIAWRRGDFAPQHSRRIGNACDLIASEDLSVNRMLQNHWLAKSIADAAWTQFAACLAHTAAWAGRRFVAVDPAYPSQDCSRCGHRQKLSLSDRVYQCPCCGLVLDRDLNAARHIRRLAHELVGWGQQSLAQA